MASVTILSDNGATSGSAGLKTSGGNDGTMLLQTTTSGGTPTTAITIDNTQTVTFTNQPTYTGGTANGVLYLNGSKAVTSGTALVFDGTNLGVGVTPSSWGGSYKALQVNSIGSLGADTSTVALGNNTFWNGSSNRYLTSAAASLYYQNSGQHVWLNAGSGTAGNAISFTQAMTLTAAGNLGIGTSSPSSFSTYRYLDLVGGGTSTGGVFQSKTSDGAVTNSLYTTGSAGAIGTSTNHPLQFLTNDTERARIDSSGNFGIGTTSAGSFKLAVSGSGDIATLSASASGQVLRLSQSSANPLIVRMVNNSNNFWDTQVNTDNTITWDYNDSARALITSGGLFSAGDTPGYLNLGYFRFNYGVGQGTIIFCVSSYPTVNEDTIRLYSVTTGGMSTAGSAMQIAKNGGTSRSINAAGTINASGADYAEYMVKAGSFTVAKGDVVGIDAEGKLTNVFADAVSFVVKSTNPSYVGGDVWFNEKQPVDSDMKPITEGPVYDAWVARMEAARATVDRIAFSGQVPVNVTGATAGQYIIPVNDNGAIKGQAVSDPTFEQYQQAVGKVIAIEQDGRARIIVKVA